MCPYILAVGGDESVAYLQRGHPGRDASHMTGPKEVCLGSIGF